MQKIKSAMKNNNKPFSTQERIKKKRSFPKEQHQ
jgi:hypothetical protein